MTTEKRVAVVGGGAVGVTAAHDLARGGAEVTLFERGTVGGGSSGRAAGVLYDAYAEDIDAAMGDRSLERFRAISGAGDFSFTECPYVLLVREGDERAAEAVPDIVERMRRHGRDVSVVDPAELGRRFPLRCDDVAAAFVAENAGWADPGSYVAAMADRARAAGVDVREGTPVSVSADPPGVVQLDHGDGAAPSAAADGVERYDAVLVAAGAHTKRLLAAAGVPVPLKPYRVQALTSGRPYRGPMCYDASAGVYFRPHPTGLLAGDGTVPVEADPDDWERDADDWFVENIEAALSERADHDVDVERAWAGLCTATPDGDPLLGELRPGLYVAAGWQGHGFMRAPATGEAVAEQILGVADGVAPFDPTRFSGDEEFDVVEGMALDADP